MLMTYAEAYKILRALQPEPEPGPSGEFAEVCAWAAVKSENLFVVAEEKLFDELCNEFESLKAEGIFKIPYG